MPLLCLPLNKLLRHLHKVEFFTRGMEYQNNFANNKLIWIYFNTFEEKKETLN